MALRTLNSRSQRDTEAGVAVKVMGGLRRIESLSVSPDRRRFAIYVRQAVPKANQYRAAWFIGNTVGGLLTRAGDGGEAHLAVGRFGHVGGELEPHRSHWSPDGRWIAYTLRRCGEVQLWRSRVDGSVQEQLTRNAGDVREFAWSDDGGEIYFTTHPERASLAANYAAKARAGLNYDEDLHDIHDLLLPVKRRAWEGNPPIWVLNIARRTERHADERERKSFDRFQTRGTRGVADFEGFINDETVVSVPRSDGALAGLERAAPFSQHLRVTAAFPSQTAPIQCHAPACEGTILKVWWSEDGTHILFWRKEGVNDERHRLYSWSPMQGEVQLIFDGVDDLLRDCTEVKGDRVICVRETKTHPVHVAAIDTRIESARRDTVQVIGEINPEFRNIAIGKVERFDWDTPRFAWNEAGGKLAGLYPKRAYGYILYPPHFDPKSKYPVFVEPYTAAGFSGSLGNEHLLHVYAANGFVVLNLEFPSPVDDSGRFGEELNALYFSPDLNFPDLSMLTESTMRGMDAAIERGFIDERRIGIGGVSTGTTVPLYMMLTHDRIAAIVISGPGWNEYEYYWGSRKEREALTAVYGAMGYREWRPRPVGEGQHFWNRINIAENIETVEAPILMHLADREAVEVVRLIRHLADAGKPYEAFVFPEETHLKWQPAHLQAIWIRNLDWFRFWLQGHEDPDPSKRQQYSSWRKLREQQEASRAGAIKHSEVSQRN